MVDRDIGQTPPTHGKGLGHHIVGVDLTVAPPYRIAIDGGSELAIEGLE
jgi:hypothetical protein